MSAKNLPWLRLYTEMVDDEKLRLLAFEDRWHYVALLCLKGSGLLDDACSADLKQRRVAVKLGLSVREVEEVARRLAEVELIDRDTLQPLGWEGRQFPSDKSTDRVKAFRERQKKQAETGDETDETGAKRFSNGLDLDSDLDSDTELEKDKSNTPPADASDAKSKTITARDLKAKGVHPQHAADFLAVRKAQRAPLTVTALENIEREAAKAKLTLAQAIQIVAERGWRGFKAEWLQRDPDRTPPAPRINQTPKDYGKSGRL
ncbi:hypothetical protein DK842_17905 [Chromobacterium phragmitis]|uniref:hypothetical protein n=1 Tax=Chromobacterium phragmitis TaxID=2202141 RepID=UPI000DEC561B|nr:hypothetical protein [Chromobacterium phragmitis]AXE31610.1 hypothetical protein DK842_17905 [Chromobacterium phragmitis]